MLSYSRPGTHGLVVVAVVVTLFVFFSQFGYLYQTSSDALPGWLSFGSSKEMPAWQRDLVNAASETGLYSEEKLGHAMLSVIEKRPAKSHAELIEYLTRTLRELNINLKKPFVDMAMNTSISGVADFTAVRTLCGSKSWRDDVVFMCESIEQGAENVRSQLLTCVRFAIESGAGIIVPEAIRSNTDSEYLFDQDASLEFLNKACPELPVHTSLEILNSTAARRVTLINPQLWLTAFAHNLATDTVLADPRDWKSQFDHWMHSTNITSADHIAVVPIEALTGKFPICHDNNAFVSSFGQILRYQPNIERLAASVLHNLALRFSLDIDPSRGIQPDAFLGVHLPDPEDDASLAGIGYLEQVDRYLHMAVEYNLTILYVAASTAGAVRRFADIANGLTIISRYDILPPDEQDELAQLSPQQQALADQLVLRKSSFFGGTVQSKADWNIALSRRAAAGLKLCPEENWLSVDGVDGVIMEHQVGGLMSKPGKALLLDSMSELTGDPESVVWAQSMWP